MKEIKIDIILIDGIIFGFLYSNYEEGDQEIVIALSFFGLRIKWW
jgi:hypothetical protein